MRETVIETGRVQGIACGWPSITAFYGIPYAAPPVGELRWRPPRPAASWSGIRDCARPGPRCPQLGVGKGSFYEREFYPVEEPMDEDCLYLNVWTPAQGTAEKLPVIFWVHGGAFMTGYGHSAHFDGEPFARQGVILVTINYRLNIFGWMVHPELSAESERHASGNYGLLDQLFALEWVRRNIAAFGGDPDNITVAGQSAGAMCVQALLTTPLTRGMIGKAVMQSGGGITAAPDMRFPSLAEAEERADLSLLGVSSIAEARALPWQELLTTAMSPVSSAIPPGRAFPLPPAMSPGKNCWSRSTAPGLRRPCPPLAEKRALPNTLNSTLPSTAGRRRRPGLCCWKSRGRGRSGSTVWTGSCLETTWDPSMPPTCGMCSRP